MNAASGVKSALRHLLLPVFFASFISCGENAPKPTAENNMNYGADALGLRIDSVVLQYQELGIFSGVVLVAREGNPVYFEAFGLADRASGRKNTRTTLFDIGSMNKTFTSIVIRQLAAEGALNLNDHLIDYLPGFTDPRAEEISLEHLLEHRSGFGDYHSPGYFELPLEQRSLQAIVDRAKTEELHFTPGTEEAYSNLGYVLLGGVIEKVTGQSYFKEVRQRIVEPLGLTHTFLQDFEPHASRMAKGYFHTPLGVLEEAAPIQDVPNPDGGFLSTAEDIMTFYRSYYYDTLLLSAKARAEDPFFQYLRDLPDGKATGAAGGFDGFNSLLLQVHSEDLTIIVLANMDEPVAERIGSDILALSRGQDPAAPQLPAIENVRRNYLDKGIRYVETHFEDITINFHPTDPRDLILNDLGYAYLYEASDTDKALELFALNTRLFPEVANCWDSYGEALRVAGQKEEARIAYNKALELEPGLETALRALEELENTP